MQKPSLCLQNYVKNFNTNGRPGRYPNSVEKAVYQEHNEDLGWEKTQILQDSGRLSCKILQVNALTWRISCKNLARFVSSCKILASFLSSCKILARFKFSSKTPFHMLPLLKIFWQLKQSFPSKQKMVQC